MNRDKNNLAYQAFPWSTIWIIVLYWLFVYGVLYLYLRAAVYGLSLVLLPEGVSIFYSLGLPVQGIALFLLIFLARRRIIKGKAPLYFQIMGSLILILTISFSTFLVLSFKKDIGSVEIPNALNTPYNVTGPAGVNEETRKFPVVVEEKTESRELKNIKRSPGSFELRLNRWLKPAGNFAYRLMKNNNMFLIFYLIPCFWAAFLVNRHFLLKLYGDYLKVSWWLIGGIWGFSLLLTVPVFIFSEYFIGMIVFPALGNMLTVMLIRRNIALNSD